MAQIRLHTLSGFMELLPEDQKKMQRVMATLRESYALYGFTPLDTPVIESADVLLAKGGGETKNRSTASRRATAILPSALISPCRLQSTSRCTPTS